jgi:hypothetical protein
MNFRTLDGSELSDFAGNLKTLLSGTDLTAIDSNVRTALLAAIGSLPDTLAAQSARVHVVEGERKAAVSDRNETRKVMIDLIIQVRDALKGARAPKGQFDLCGFNYRSSTLSRYMPADPADLWVVGFSNGINRGRFAGNNVGTLVHYEIWRREDKNGPWLFHLTAKKQSFVDSPVVPGKYLEYRVRAIAARAISNFSNTVVVYGT